MIHLAELHGRHGVCKGCGDQLGTIDLDDEPDVYLVTSWCRPRRPGVTDEAMKVGLPRALNWLTRQHLYAWIRQPELTPTPASTRLDTVKQTNRRRTASDAVHQIILTEADARCAEHHLAAGTTPTAGGGLLDINALRVIHELQLQLEKSRTHWAISARVGGQPWSAIAEALGVSRQAVHKQYGAMVEQASADEDHGWPWWHRLDHGTCPGCSRPLAGTNATKNNDRCTYVLIHELGDRRTVSLVCKRCHDDPNTPHRLDTEPMV